jgi:hypothetical protein
MHALEDDRQTDDARHEDRRELGRAFSVPLVPTPWPIFGKT